MPDDPKKPFPDDEDESTRVKAPPAPTFIEESDEDEPTKVLDWDRAMRKSLEEPDKTPKK